MAEIHTPFQVLTLIVAPAILTNSSSILSLSTSNRFARTVDRARYLYERMKEPEKLSQQEMTIFQKQRPIMARRSLLLVRALTCFYVSVGSFAATAFASIVGAVISLYNNALAAKITTSAAIIAGSLGVIGLVAGTALLVWEMWLALHFMRVESQLTHEFPNSPII